MSNVAVNTIVEAKVATIISTLMQVAYDNVVFKETRGLPFVEVMLECTEAHNVAIKCRRENFLIELRVHTPYGEGVERNLAMADSIVNGFVGYQSGTFKCKGGRVARGGKVDEWHQRVVFLDAQYDQPF